MVLVLSSHTHTTVMCILLGGTCYNANSAYFPKLDLMYRLKYRFTAVWSVITQCYSVHISVLYENCLTWFLYFTRVVIHVSIVHLIIIIKVSRVKVDEEKNCGILILVVFFLLIIVSWFCVNKESFLSSFFTHTHTYIHTFTCHVPLYICQWSFDHSLFTISSLSFLIESIQTVSTNWPKLAWFCTRVFTIMISILWPLLLTTPKISFSFV